MSATWWEGRRGARLADLASALVFFGAELLEDPGVGELAHAAGDLAGEYLASDRGCAVHRAGGLLQQAAVALHAADRLRGTAVPVVNHHLRGAAAALDHARGLLREESGRRCEQPSVTDEQPSVTDERRAPPWPARR
ncbi:hypothetical protein J5Y04_16875 [Kitasatospora sp. RG8]|uniref:hypothetical protein n=1 Tax=Kitasatospora sp. RG8 TaxID=2820815 RepID=UPI001AE08C2C|nr:hypothetical protein [Kitasatospora sp. RG8]MBP0451202.1 hypothetical protein [Kitasatospora sp. RG8]